MSWRRRLGFGLVGLTVASAVFVPAVLAGKRAAAPPIKVGLIAPVGVPSFSDPQMVAAARAAVRGANARGGINGQTVQLIYCNDKNDPNLGTACARKMVSEHVVAMIGLNTLSDAMVIPILAKA